MNEKRILVVIDKIWEGVGGSEGWRHTLHAFTTYVRIEKSENGKIEGKGLWGSEGIPFIIDFNTGNLKCECLGMKTAQHDGGGPCCHILRGLLQIEAQIANKKLEQIFQDRQSSVIPF